MRRSQPPVPSASTTPANQIKAIPTDTCSCTASITAYNILYHIYFSGMKVADLAEQMAIAEQTLYQARNEALADVAQVLLSEWDAPRDAAGRRNDAVADRYALHSSQEQQLLRLLAAFQQAVPPAQLHELAARSGVPNVDEVLHRLVTANWVIGNESGTELLLYPELRPLLLTRVYIDRANLYLEERPNLEQAKVDLQAAERLVPANDRATAADLHTAWLTLAMRCRQWSTAFERGMQAWLAAQEAQDVGRMTNTAHNLGRAYARSGQFDQAETYLERSLRLAQEAGNRQMVGLNQKTLGGCRFMRGAYPQAVAHYREAAAVFADMCNRNWLAHTYYDLAEVYGTLGDWGEARHFYLEGLQLAHDLRDERLSAEFAELAQRFDALALPLNDRQLLALQHVRQHGSITNREYQQINEVSARQALRDLQELEEQQQLRKVGQGRSTRYELFV